jgi:hypothetical protein
MTDTIHDIVINTDAITIADLPLLIRASRGELDGEALVDLCERVTPGARKLPIRYLHVILGAINAAVTPRPN